MVVTKNPQEADVCEVPNPISKNILRPWHQMQLSKVAKKNPARLWAEVYVLHVINNRSFAFRRLELLVYYRAATNYCFHN